MYIDSVLLMNVLSVSVSLKQLILKVWAVASASSIASSMLQQLSMFMPWKLTIVPDVNGATNVSTMGGMCYVTIPTSSSLLGSALPWYSNAVDGSSFPSVRCTAC